MTIDENDSTKTHKKFSTPGNGFAANPMPKHIPFPDCNGSSELLNELILFLFTACCAAMQYINIYRAVWWIPELNNKHYANIRLIEPYLATFIFIFSSRRFIYCLVLRAFEAVPSNKKLIYIRAFKMSYGGGILSVLGYCAFKVSRQHTYLSMCLLYYPCIVYLIVFGFHLEPFLRSSKELKGAYLNGMPMHCCSSNPATIRNEIDMLRLDFNYRVKQTMFTAAINAYYAGFIPCVFAVSMHFNMMWMTQQVFYMWVSGITISTVFAFPAKYCDILHRACLHLGLWMRYDATASNSGGILSGPAAVWNKSSLWGNNVVVKYNGELFRCYGPVTVALPGNSSHSRFYKIFSTPSSIYLVLTIIQATIIFTQISLLYLSVEWQFVISISFVSFTNQFTFYKLFRDFLLTKRVYNSETAILVGGDKNKKKTTRIKTN